MLAEIFGTDLVIVIVIVAVLLVGGTQIPKLARSLGSAKNQFEQGMKEGQAESAKNNGTNGTSAASDAPAQAPAPPAEGKSQTG